MNRQLRLLLAVMTGVTTVRAEPLFNGRDLTGWKPKGADVWTFADGVLTGRSNSKKQGSILWSDEKFKDFILELEFRFTGNIDSGVFLRHADDQIQIGTSISLKRDMTGSPYIGPVGKYVVEAHDVKGNLKDGDWNKFRITAKGAHYKVELNGKEVLDYTSLTAAKEGPLGLQVHQGIDMKIEFRNVDLIRTGDK